MNRGCVFFNFGDKCILRMLIAIWSLRKVYNGPITLMLAPDEANQKFANELSNDLNFIVQWFDIDLSIPNVYSTIKPNLFRLSPYEDTLLFDGDLLFVKSIDKCWGYFDNKQLVVSKFSNWLTNSNDKTLKNFKQLPSVGIDDTIFVKEGRPYINIGVLGVKKTNSDILLKEWEELTTKLIGKVKIADEVALHVIYEKYDYSLLDESYNRSFQLGLTPVDESHIFHYHGNGHRKLKYHPTKIWWQYLKQAKKEIKGIEYWISKDPFVPSIISEKGII